MRLQEVIEPGDKIDIRLIQQVEQAKRTGEEIKVYKSSVLDITGDSEIEISMPTEGSRMVLLPVDVRFDFLFLNKNGIFECVGKVKDRYKKDNFYMLAVELDNRLEKIQRREYYRMECVLDMNFYVISEEVAQLRTTDEIFQSLRDENFFDKDKKGAILDISGGGIRFVSEEPLEKNVHILVVVHLNNEKMDQQFYIVGQVISCERNLKDPKKYESRVKFLFKDPKVREAIIRFIFEEERRARKRENG